MMAILISIHPEWCDKILNGEKTVEIRKTKPKLKTPFKCYIYMTKQSKPSKLGGYVIAEFLCDDIKTISYPYYFVKEDLERAVQGSCVSPQQLIDYASWKEKITCVYGWHISRLKIYENQKCLNEFTMLRSTRFGYESIVAKSAPQSWFYVEEQAT